MTSGNTGIMEDQMADRCRKPRPGRAVVRQRGFWSLVTLGVSGLAWLGAASALAADSRAVEMRADSAGGALGIREVTPASIAGVYQRGGRGLRFSASEANDTVALLLETLDGRELLRITDRGPEAELLVFGEYQETVDKASLARRRQALLAQERRGLVLPEELPPLQIKQRGDIGTVYGLIALPEYDLLPWLSRALGERGYTGRDFPASLPIHLIAVGAARYKHIQVTPLVMPPVVSGKGATAWPFCPANGAFCLINNCPRSGDCFGMCGPKCTCWWWVCFDCCAHAGCAFHDANCGPDFLTCTLNFWQFFIGGCLPWWP